MARQSLNQSLAHKRPRHIIRRYSLKLLDTENHLYRLMLHYNAVQGEGGIDKDVLKPSIRDDWDLYKKIEKAEMKKFCSEAGYNAWLTQEEREVKDCEE